MTDKAVSEIIGFIIIFGIVVTSIGLVYSNAVPQLQESREIQNIENSKRAFSVLQNNINDVAIRGAPSRSTQIRLEGSSVDTKPSNNGIINITVKTSSNKYNLGPSQYNPIVYTNTNDLSIVYENGAVFREIRGGGSGMSYRPNWRINEDEFVLPVIDTKGGESVGGTSTVLLRADQSGSTTTNVSESVEWVNVTVESPRADGWGLYMQGLSSDLTGIDFEQLPSQDDKVAMNVSGSPGNLERFVYTETNIEIGTER